MGHLVLTYFLQAAQGLSRGMALVVTREMYLISTHEIIKHYLWFDLFLLAVLVQPCGINFAIEMANVAHNGIFLHLDDKKIVIT